jgi:16S rRNA G966 N2-methylase RsmD
MTPLTFETWPIERLTEYARNPRKNDHAVDKIAAAIKEFGFRVPVVAKSDGLVVDGHLRLKAAKKLGMAEVPVILADDMTEAQIKAFRISVNRMAEFAEWDNDLLALEFAELTDMGFDLDLTGFTADEIDALTPVQVEEGLTDEDAVPDVPVDPVTRVGDVWILGQHRLMCGNSTMLHDVEILMNGTTPDCIHTDPPYGMNAVSKSSVLKKNYKQDILGDDTPDVAKDAFRLIYGMWPDAKQIWWGANYYSSVLPDSECWLVWDKDNGQSDQTDCELAWANFRSVVRQFTMASEKKNRVHPTQKPVALMEWIIRRFKLSVKTIADFFGGSGSTLIAAEKHGVQAFIMEFDPRFCDVIVKRWQDFTGKIATHAETGEPFAEVTNGKANS